MMLDQRLCKQIFCKGLWLTKDYAHKYSVKAVKGDSYKRLYAHKNSWKGDSWPKTYAHKYSLKGDVRPKTMHTNIL